MKIEHKPEDLAYLSETLPCNPLPFLNRMQELIKVYGTDACKSPEYRANLWVLMAQTYTPTSVIPLSEEWTRLSKLLDK